MTLTRVDMSNRLGYLWRPDHGLTYVKILIFVEIMCPDAVKQQAEFRRLESAPDWGTSV